MYLRGSIYTDPAIFTKRSGVCNLSIPGIAASFCTNATNNLFVCISKLPLLCWIPSCTIRGCSERGKWAGTEKKVTHDLWIKSKYHPGKNLKSCLLSLREQFPGPMQGIQISVISDTINLNSSPLLFVIFSVFLPRWERDCWGYKRNQKWREVQREGELSVQIWHLPMRWLQMTMQ